MGYISALMYALVELILVFPLVSSVTRYSISV